MALKNAMSLWFDLDSKITNSRLRYVIILILNISVTDTTNYYLFTQKRKLHQH